MFNPVEQAISEARQAIERAESAIADQYGETSYKLQQVVLNPTLSHLTRARHSLNAANDRYDRRHQ